MQENSRKKRKKKTSALDYRSKFFEYKGKNGVLLQRLNRQKKVEKSLRDEIKRKNARIRNLENQIKEFQSQPHKQKQKLKKVKKPLKKAPEKDLFFPKLTNSTEELQIALAIQESLSQNMQYPIDDSFNMIPPQTDFYSAEYSVPENATYEELLQLDDNKVVVGLEKEILSQFPITKYSSDSMKENLCVICCENLSEGESIRTLPCFHYFHLSCIDKWLEINKKCPVCYSVLDEL